MARRKLSVQRRSGSSFAFVVMAGALAFLALRIAKGPKGSLGYVVTDDGQYLADDDSAPLLADDDGELFRAQGSGLSHVGHLGDIVEALDGLGGSLKKKLKRVKKALKKVAKVALPVGPLLPVPKGLVPKPLKKLLKKAPGSKLLAPGLHIGAKKKGPSAVRAAAAPATMIAPGEEEYEYEIEEEPPSDAMPYPGPAFIGPDPTGAGDQVLAPGEESPGAPDYASEEMVEEDDAVEIDDGGDQWVDASGSETDAELDRELY